MNTYQYYSASERDKAEAIGGVVAFVAIAGAIFAFVKYLEYRDNQIPDDEWSDEGL